MSVTVQGHPCVAFKDPSSYYSVLTRGYVRSNGLGDWRNTCLSLSIDIRLHNFAFTLRVDFILVNDLPNCDAVFGLQFNNLCRSSECDWLYDLLPITNLPPEVILPLPPLPLSSGLPAIAQSATSHDSPFVSFSAADSSTPVFSESIGVPVSHKTTKNMVGPDSSGDAGYVAASSNRNISDNEIDSYNKASSSSLSQSTIGARVPSSEQVLFSCLFGNSTSGVKCSMFFSEHPNFSSYAELHGLDLIGLHSHRQRRNAVIYHILSGHCFLNRHVQKSSACCMFVAGFSSEVEFFDRIGSLISQSKAKELPVAKLKLIMESLNIQEHILPNQPRRQMLKYILRYINRLSAASSECVTRELPLSVEDIFKDFGRLRFSILLQYCRMHNIEVNVFTATSIELRQQLASHVLSAECHSNAIVFPDNICPIGCRSIAHTFHTQPSDFQPGNESLSDFRLLLTHLLSTKLSLGTLRSVLQILEVPFNDDDNKRTLRLRLQEFNGSDQFDFQGALQEKKLSDLRAAWPVLISDSLKQKLVHDFQLHTSSQAMKHSVCAACSSHELSSACHVVTADSVNLSLLYTPDTRAQPNCPSVVVDPSWLDEDCQPPTLKPVLDQYPNALLDKQGVTINEHGDSCLSLCRSCYSALRNGKTPALSLANHMYIGEVPDILKGLTVVEEAMISRCRAKSWIVQLKEHQDVANRTTQRGLKGNVIVYPQKPSSVAKLLPPSLDELTAPICVIFVGSSQPSDEWLRTKAKPLTARPKVVRDALIWLKAHNKWYKDIEINYSLLRSLPDDFVLPVHVERVEAVNSNDNLTSGYVPSDGPVEDVPIASALDEDIIFENVVIADVDANATINELRAAAMRHIKSNGGSYVEIPHESVPMNEFFNPSLFPMIYPTLFPYGIGGFEDYHRSVCVSLKRHVKYLLNLSDRRFQEHYSFSFTAFNILQRRNMLLRTALKAKKSNFSSIASQFASVTPTAIAAVADRFAKGDLVSFRNSEERAVLQLMEQVNLVTSTVPGSSSALVNMRNEIRALMIDQGLPSFYITINPADVYNPLVKFLAGSEIDIDCMLPTDVPSYWDQAMLVAKNPVVAAKFFNIYMKAFIRDLLGYDPNDKELTGGILGAVKGYYGCVEAQGRGTLHCHMMVWLEGSLNPNEIREKAMGDPDSPFCRRLIAFLDDTISNSVPAASSNCPRIPSTDLHPSSVRGTTMLGYHGYDCDSKEILQQDLHNLVHSCQVHKHTATCYKYCKDNSKPKECRFGLDDSNVVLESCFDPDTGELNLRCLDGLVNNFNETMLRAIRCNMDIKFIGSGASAKAVLYYITNYITKSQLKAHVAYAALERAVRRLDEQCPDDSELTIRAKKLLQKCAYSMISQQELSAQQVNTYLLDFEDHFTSHKYKNLYWVQIENLVENELPSPECQPARKAFENVLATFTGDPIDTTNEVIDCNLSSEVCNEHESNDALAEDDHEVEDDEEVGIAVGVDGSLVAKASQVDDYRYRPVSVEDLCLWEQVAQCKKARKVRQNVDIKDFVDENEALEDSIEDRDEGSDSDDPITMPALSELLGHRSHEHPKFDFNTAHPEYSTHLFIVDSSFNRRIPVPIGPSLPRRDRESDWPRYCRLMLIFFKPWRNAADLRGPYLDWSEAFAAFALTCSDRVKQMMDNMQIMHECKDSRDDHFLNRNSARRLRNSRSYVGAGDKDRLTEDDFLAEHDNEPEILEHLLSIEGTQSQYVAKLRTEALSCVQYMDASGFFGAKDDTVLNTQTQVPATIASDCAHLVVEDHPREEQAWKDEYLARKMAWRKKSCMRTDIMDVDVGTTNEATINNIPSDDIVIDEADVRPPIHARSALGLVNIEKFLNEFKPALNIEQERAFRLIASHTQENNPAPLRMFLGGPGGTGKSHVISALKVFFEQQGELRRFRLASYTGVAAQNISGMTLHSALLLSSTTSSHKTNSKSHQDLVALWQGVDYLFIDEVSMLGCRFMLKISRALCRAKDNNLPFGGINIIFAGDFAQLAPVREQRLFSFINTARVGTNYGQEIVFGKLLWLSVKTVVLLTQVMRQSGLENEPFVELLSRLRTGVCTLDDYDILNSRIISTVQPNWCDAKWENTPTIVSNNRVKDMINERSTAAFAKRTGKPLHWYYASDTRGGKPVNDIGLQSFLENMDSGQTNHRLGRIPLVIGMPIMITQNFDVQGGVVNGCHGVLKSIRYRLDEQGRRHAISCVVSAPKTSAEAALPYLEHKTDVVALEDKISLSFTHEFTRKKCTFQRTQLPVAPAFAFTTHKAQGQTLDSAIVDLESCRGTEAPYVMVSRVKTLDGLLVLRPFQLKKIQCRQSEDSRSEHKRLHLLALETIVNCGSYKERVDAQTRLGAYKSQSLTVADDDVESPHQLDVVQQEVAHLRHIVPSSGSYSSKSQTKRQTRPLTASAPESSGRQVLKKRKIIL